MGELYVLPDVHREFDPPRLRRHRVFFGRVPSVYDSRLWHLDGTAIKPVDGVQGPDVSDRLATVRCFMTEELSAGHKGESTAALADAGVNS